MKRSGIGVAIFIIIMLTAALVAVMYLGNQWFGAAFVPVDLYTWLEQLGLTPLSSVASRLMSMLVAAGVGPATAESATTTTLAIILFGIATLLIGLVFYFFSGRRGRKPDWIDGLTASVILSAFTIFVSLAAGSSNLPPAINITWLVLLALGWGISLSYALARTMLPISPMAPPTGEADQLPDEAEMEAELLATIGGDNEVDNETVSSPEASPSLSAVPGTMDRRQFLLRFGAGTAAIAAAGATAGSALAFQSAEVEQVRLPIPMASPDFLEAQRELFGTFRRFVILRDNADVREESNVLALGTEYPDRDYVSIWIGDRSPIIIYESIETALAAFGNEDQPASIYWLDG